ncbi:glucosyltransferase [Hypoxylon texense]
MDKQLDVLFDRVEKALGTLVDSIAKYHPSVAQVNDLGLADIELNRGLEDLQKHQSNYRRIQDLRAATASFDGQIKDTLRLLANTRKELVSTAATVFPANAPSYDVNYNELLSYARRISKTTMPPAGALNGVSSNGVKAEGNEAVGGGGTETAATTPAGGTPNGAQSQPAQANGVQQQDSSAQPQQSAAVTTTDGGSTSATVQLPEDLQAQMNPYTSFSFAPWPSEEQVRKGALASLAFLADQGIDPENYDPEAEKLRKEREEEERRAREEREREEREERERRAREEQQARRAEQERQERERERVEALRRGSMVGGTAAGAPPSMSPTVEKQGQFKFMDDDDDDSDE